MTKASRPSYANVVRKGGDTEVRGKQMTNEGALPSEQKNEFNSDDTFHVFNSFHTGIIIMG